MIDEDFVGKLNQVENFFPENLGQLSDEQGERFHQEISTVEKRFARKSQVRMLANYCWSLKRETDDSSHKRKRSSKHFKFKFVEKIYNVFKSSR